MANQGWIKLHRSLLESEIYGIKPMCPVGAFVDLLLRVNHKDNPWLGKTILRGQLWTSKRKLQSSWRVRRDTVDQYLSCMQGLGMIDVQYFPTGLMITILNYDKYQANTDASQRTQNGTHSGTHYGTQSGTQNGTHSGTTNNNDKECLKNEEENGRRPSFRDPDSFED